MFSVIKSSSRYLRYNENDLCLLYERYNDGTSLLAMKLNNSEKETGSDYLFYKASINIIGNKVYVDVEMHSFSGKVLFDVSRVIGGNIISFFENIENEIFSNNINPDDIVYRIMFKGQSFDNIIKRLEENEISKTSNDRFIKRFFNRFNPKI